VILLNALKKIGNIYNKVEEVTLAVMLAGSLMILFINVILRKFFNGSIYGADELARVLFIWMSWLGISIGERRSEHIRIDMLVQKLHGVPKKTVELIANIITLCILAVLVYYGIGIVEVYMRKGVATSMYKIPQALVYASVPFSCGVMAIRLLFHTIDIFKKPDLEEGGTGK
jgi:TRAP-type C4-dicarboxylate transport system permease small subunit